MSEEAKKAAREWHNEIFGVGFMHQDRDEELAELLDSFADARVEEARRGLQDAAVAIEEAARVLDNSEEADNGNGLVIGVVYSLRKALHRARIIIERREDLPKAEAPEREEQKARHAAKLAHDSPKAEEKCGRCNATGRIWFGGKPQYEKCPDCSGTGKVGK